MYMFYGSGNKWTSGGIDYLLYIIIYNKYGIMQYSTYGSDKSGGMGTQL